MAFSQHAAFDLLHRAYEQNRLAHAYLIAGGETSGTVELARRLAGMVVGPAAASAPDAFRHPDVHIAAPESKSRRIIVEQIRELERELRMSATGTGKKVGIILEADRLQPQASNAFLKTLEEPPANAILLLVTAMPEALLDTVLSRCILVPLRATEPETFPEEREQLGAALDKAASSSAEGIPFAFQFVREFTRLLHAAREQIQSEVETAKKKEEAHYRQTTESEWLKEREEYYKGLAESRYIRARNRLIDAFMEQWACVLRRRNGAPASETPIPALSHIAESLPPGQLLRKIELLQELRENLGRNVQETLAIEAAFLSLFGG